MNQYIVTEQELIHYINMETILDYLIANQFVLDLLKAQKELSDKSLLTTAVPPCFKEIL